MSKESRRRQRDAGRSPAGPAGSGRPPAEAGATHRAASGRPSIGPTGTPRVGRRERTRPGVRASFLQRYRSLLLGLAVAAVVVIVGVGMFSAATQPVYACSNVWDPSPTPAPAEGSAPQPGYAQPDMGQGHIGNGARNTFTYCPPASGKHFNGTATGPVSARVYGPDDGVNPQGWIHNLEHGGMVILYRGNSEGASAAGQTAMRAFFDRYPPSPVCGFAAGTNVGPVFARFDDMAWPFAALVWGRVLPLQSLDEAAIMGFDSTYGEKTNPEKFCEASPGPSAPTSPAPSASAEPSPTAAPSPSASAVPGESVAPSPSAS
ncbi:MAG: DUF3105 domain-containing protein [Candidatus Limnocylindrales bacterium]